MVMRLLLAALGGLALTGCGSGLFDAGSREATAAELATALDPAELDTSLLAEAIWRETNRVREQHDLRRLRRYRRLAEAAELQATTNALLQTVSHDNPLLGRATVADRVREVGLEARQVAENVGRVILPDESGGGAAPVPSSYAEVARRIVQHFMDSPTHRENLLNPSLTHLACGVAVGRTPEANWRVHYAQVFFVPAD